MLNPCIKCGRLEELSKEYFCKDCEKGIILIQKDTFRSRNEVNKTDDMVRVVLNMSIKTWCIIRRELGIKEKC